MEIYKRGTVEKATKQNGIPVYMGWYIANVTTNFYFDPYKSEILLRQLPLLPEILLSQYCRDLSQVWLSYITMITCTHKHSNPGDTPLIFRI